MKKPTNEKVTGGITLVRASEIPILPVVWLWPGWLAAGKLHILAGSPGAGKTMISLYTAAVLSRGGIWPDGTSAPRGRVIIWSGEDSRDDTILPRLRAAGADMDNVFILRADADDGYERRFNPIQDLEQLRANILKLGDVKLIILDSIVQVASGEKNNQVRQALEPLVGLAEEYGIAILGISHTNKGSAKKNPVDSVTGTLAFTAVARVVWIVGPSRPLEERKRSSWGVLVRAKSNLGRCDGGFCYEIASQAMAPSIDTASLAWHLPMLEGSAKEILQEAQGERLPESNSQLRMAEEFLLARLAQGEWVGVDLEREAIELGYSLATLRRARKSLGVISKKVYLSERHAANIWSLSEAVVGKPSNAMRAAQPPQGSPSVNTPGFRGTGQPSMINQGPYRDLSRFSVEPQFSTPLQPHAVLKPESSCQSQDGAEEASSVDEHDDMSLLDALKRQHPSIVKYDPD